MSKQEECPLEPLTVYNIIGMKRVLDAMRRSLVKTIEDIDFRLAEYKHHMDCHEKVLQDMEKRLLLTEVNPYQRSKMRETMGRYEKK